MMRTKLLILSVSAVCLVCLFCKPIAAQAPDSAAQNRRQHGQAGPKNGQASEEVAGSPLLQKAKKALEQHYTVSAQVTQAAQLFGHEVIGSGNYCEQRSNQGLQFRLEMSIQTRDDEEPSSLLQVCDGQYQWEYRKLRDSENVTRVDLAHIQRRLEEEGKARKLNPLRWWPGLQGLPMLIDSFDRFFEFGPPTSVDLQKGFPAWKLEGRWRPKMLVRCMPDHVDVLEQGGGVATEELPDQLPNLVVLLLGKDDLFPYSIAFYRLAGTTTDVTASRHDQPIVRVNLSKVRFNQPLPPERFSYQPGDREFVDQTRMLLDQLNIP